MKSREISSLLALGKSGGKLQILKQAAGHLGWKVDYPPPQPVDRGSNLTGGSQPAKLPSFGGYSLGNLKPSPLEATGVAACATQPTQSSPVQCVYIL